MYLMSARNRTAQPSGRSRCMMCSGEPRRGGRQELSHVVLLAGLSGLGWTGNTHAGQGWQGVQCLAARLLCPVVVLLM